MTAVAALVLAASGGWIASPSYPTMPWSTRCASPPRCCGDVTPEAIEAIPPGQLAEAWQREEQAKELGDVLKGCSLYLVGVGPKRAMVGRVLARRLSMYRCYDVSSLMCSTYKTVAATTEEITLPELLATEPLADVEQLSDLIMREVQALKRCVVTPWDGCIKASDYMIMQQGIVINMAFDEIGDVALPSDDTEMILETWRAGHEKADLTVQLPADVAADDAAFKIIETVLKFIADNPGRSKEWKEKADEALKAKDGNS